MNNSILEKLEKFIEFDAKSLLIKSFLSLILIVQIYIIVIIPIGIYLRLFGKDFLSLKADYY